MYIFYFQSVTAQTRVKDSALYFEMKSMIPTYVPPPFAVLFFRSVLWVNYDHGNCVCDYRVQGTSYC